MSKRSALLVLASMFVTSTAIAQPGRQEPVLDPPPAPRKSEETALTLSIVGTLGSIGVIALGASLSGPDTADGPSTPGADRLMLAGAAGLIMAPSLGHWYARDYWTPGLGLRLLGAGGLVVGAGAAIGSAYGGGDNGAAAILLLSATSFVAGTVWDIVTADDAARAYNDEHQLRLAPTALVTPNGMAGGFALGGRF